MQAELSRYESTQPREDTNEQDEQALFSHDDMVQTSQDQNESFTQQNLEISRDFLQKLEDKEK